MKLNDFCFFILITVLSGLWLGNKATAQIVPCAVADPPRDSIIALEKRLLKLKGQFVKNARTSGLTAVQYIPIKAHILRKSDGTGGLSLADLNTALVQINRYFQNVGSGLQLYFCGFPTIINNTAYYDYNNTDEQALCNANNVSNAINVYFPHSIRVGSQTVSGYAYFPSTLSISNTIFVQAQAATDNRTLAHELGHYFNLLHTFQNSNNTNNAEWEYVTRNTMQGANCALKGDLLCDTPADPYGRDSVTIQGCTYTGTARDPQGQLYVPSLSNIMSYYPLSCGSDFTPDQYTRMFDGFLLRTDPSNQYNYSCGPTITGSNVPGNLTGMLLASGLSLNFVDNSSNELGFIIERSSISASEGFVPIGGLPPNTTTFIDQTITAYTTYHYRVKASNSSTDYSAVFTISTALNYCTPTYTYACSTAPVIIDEFVLKQAATTIINNKDSNCAPANYGDYTNTPYPVMAGNTYTFTIAAVAQGGGSYYDQHVSVWADFDQDGYFELNERVYRSDSLVSMPRMNPTASGSFLIPSSVQGLVRVRVRSGYNFGESSAVTNPCGLLAFGETEDYMVQVTSISPATITNTTVSPSPICAGGTINVGFTAVNFSSTSYAVQLSDDTGNNFITLPTTGTGSPLIAEIPVNITSGTGYKVRVISNSPSVTGSTSSAFTINALPTSPEAVTPISYCQGQPASALSAVGTNLKWYLTSVGGEGSGTAPAPSTVSSGTINYWISQTVNNCESTRTKIDVVVAPTPVAPGVTTPIAYTQGQIAAPLSAVGTNLKWYLSSSGGIGSIITPIPSTVDVGTTDYYVSQTENNCESSRAAIRVNVISATAVCLNITLFLEGPYIGNQAMTTKLNQQGLLPGQVPISSLGIPTPPGQPYTGTPWNYSGSETVTSYPPNAIDWILISLRTVAQDPLTTVFRTAALLLSNGNVSWVGACPVLPINQSYFVVVEHRNHIGAISHQAVPVVNYSINYNFSTQQSYIPVGSPANGQKQFSAGFFALYAADCTKDSISQIDANDTSKWRADNGKVGRYLTTDFNMDGTPDANDNTLWRLNNGRFSGGNFY